MTFDSSYFLTSAFLFSPQCYDEPFPGASFYNFSESAKAASIPCVLEGASPSCWQFCWL